MAYFSFRYSVLAYFSLFWKWGIVSRIRDCTKQMTPMVWCNEAEIPGKSATGPTERTPKPEYLIARWQQLTYLSVGIRFHSIFDGMYGIVQNGCFQKWWYPQIIHFNRAFHYKPSILGYPYFRKPPYIPSSSSSLYIWFTRCRENREPCCFLLFFRGCLGANLIKNNRELEDQGTKIMDQFYCPYHGSMVYLPTWMLGFLW